MTAEAWFFVCLGAGIAVAFAYEYLHPGARIRPFLTGAPTDLHEIVLGMNEPVPVEFLRPRVAHELAELVETQTLGRMG